MEKYATLILDASKCERDHGQEEMPRWNGTHILALSKPIQHFRQRHHAVWNLPMICDYVVVVCCLYESIADTV